MVWSVHLSIVCIKSPNCWYVLWSWKWEFCDEQVKKN